MPDGYLDVDVVRGVITYLRPLFPTSGAQATVVTDEFPLDGAFGAKGRLISVEVTYAADLEHETRSQAEVTVNVWGPDRSAAHDMAYVVHRALTRRGGFPLVEKGVRTGTVTRGAATLRPIGEPSGDANDVLSRYVATYDLSVRATAAA